MGMDHMKYTGHQGVSRSQGLMHAENGTAVERAIACTDTFCHKGKTCSWTIRPLPGANNNSAANGFMTAPSSVRAASDILEPFASCYRR